MIQLSTDTVSKMAQATSDLIQASFPMMDEDLCNDPRIVAFIHAATLFADATGTVLAEIKEYNDDYAVS